MWLGLAKNNSPSHISVTSNAPTNRQHQVSLKMMVIIDLVADVQLFHQNSCIKTSMCSCSVCSVPDVEWKVFGCISTAHSTTLHLHAQLSIRLPPVHHVLAFPPSGLILCSPLSILYVVQTHQGISLLTSSQNDLFGSRITAYL